jgi:Holliday junction resolvasome RuvABC DNA-binding subunit
MDVSQSGGAAMTNHGELYETLTALGYNSAEINHAIKELGSPSINDENFNTVLKECIKVLGK